MFWGLLLQLSLGRGVVNFVVVLEDSCPLQVPAEQDWGENRCRDVCGMLPSNS